LIEEKHLEGKHLGENILEEKNDLKQVEENIW